MSHSPHHPTITAAAGARSRVASTLLRFAAASHIPQRFWSPLRVGRLCECGLLGAKEASWSRGQSCDSQRPVQGSCGARLWPLSIPRRSVAALSKRIHVDFDAPPELVEAIAERVVELLAPKFDAPDEWLTALEAAEYLRCPISRIYALSSARRIPLYRDGSRLFFKRSEL